MTNNKRLSCYIRAIISVIILVILDQYTKRLAVAHLKDQDPIIWIKGVFQLRYLENRGAAFGMLQNQKIFFLIICAVMVGFVVVFFRRVPLENKFIPLRICAVLITAGAIGNFIDRLLVSYVVDFFYFNLINFPIFNVADIYVTVAAFALMFLVFAFYKEEDLDRVFHNGRRSGKEN